MAYMSIEVPDDFALRLETVKDRLVDILQAGYQAVIAEQPALQEEVADFLASGPSPEEIVAFRPSAKNNDRIRTLLDKNRRTNLSTQEEAELDQAESLDYFMIRVKARARSRLQKHAKAGAK